MECSEARTRLLEADAREWSADADTALAQHVRSCLSCRRAAETIDAGQAALGEALVVLAHSPTPSVIMAEGAPVGRRRTYRWRSLAVAAAVLLAVAAGLQWNRRATTPPAIVPSLATESEDPRLRVSSSSNMVVMETQNPKITVMWFYKRGT